MPSVALHARALLNDVHRTPITNSLPSILRTPSGLGILEIQGTIHAPFPQPDNEDAGSDASTEAPTKTQIGRLEFPLFDPTDDSKDLKWMKRVYLYVGKHQRLTGEVRKLPKPLLVVGKRTKVKGSDQVSDKAEDEQGNEGLEILEIVRHKILFGGRPEPVGE